MAEDELTLEEMESLEGTYNYPPQEEKENIFSFFKRVISMPNTLRTANLTGDELGGIRIPVRTLHKLSLYCKQMGLTGLGEHFAKEAHIITDSSLSREGFLDKLAVTQKREMEAKTKMPATEEQKKGWFKKGKKGGFSGR